MNKYKLASNLFLVIIFVCYLLLLNDSKQINRLTEDIIQLESERRNLILEINDLKSERDLILQREKWNIEKIKELQDQVIELQQRKYVGQFKITYYTAGVESTGKTPDHPEYGMTATGTEVIPEYTISADWDVLPPGTRVYIEGVGERVVEDSGGGVKGNHIDVYVPELEVAKANGVSYANVYILEEES